MKVSGSTLALYVTLAYFFFLFFCSNYYVITFVVRYDEYLHVTYSICYLKVLSVGWKPDGGRDLFGPLVYYKFK